VSDIDTGVVDSLKALDHERPIREADSCTAAINALLRIVLPNFRQQLMWTLQASETPLGAIN
jgi:hypothetical protein